VQIQNAYFNTKYSYIQSITALLKDAITALNFDVWRHRGLAKASASGCFLYKQTYLIYFCFTLSRKFDTYLCKEQQKLFPYLRKCLIKQSGTNKCYKLCIKYSGFQFIQDVFCQVPISKFVLNFRIRSMFMLWSRVTVSHGLEGHAHVKISQLVSNTRKNAQVVTSLQTSCYKSVHKLSTSCVRTLPSCCNKFGAGSKQCEHILLTSCWNSIATSLLQVCYNLCVFTRVHT
jgi:hypothetical protein